MTLLHFDLRKPVRRTGFRTHFFTKFKYFQNKEQNLRKKLPIDDKFLNCWNWFINSKIMTLLHFDLRKPVRRTGLRTHFDKIQKITK